MSDSKKDQVDPLAQTGFADRPVDPLARTGIAQQAVDPLAATSFGAQHGAPAQPAAPVVEAPRVAPRRQSHGLRWAVLAIALVGAAVTGIVLATSQHPAASPAPAAPAPAAKPAPVAPTTVDALLAAQDQALADGTTAALGTLLAPDIWGIGIAASEVRFGADGNHELVRHVIGTQVQSFTKKRWTGHTSDAAWAATVYSFADGHQVELTEAMTVHDGHWRIDAWHWSVPLANGRAYELAQAGMLPKPAELPEGKAAPDPAVEAMLNDRATYVAAISPRDDAFAFGSAPGELMVGGAAITRAFSHMDATFSLRSGPIVRHVAGDLAFALANVDFTNKAGIQTFRVLLVLESGKLVLAHWSNASGS